MNKNWNYSSDNLFLFRTGSTRPSEVWPGVGDPQCCPLHVTQERHLQIRAGLNTFCHGELPWSTQRAQRTQRPGAKRISRLFPPGEGNDIEILLPHISKGINDLKENVAQEKKIFLRHIFACPFEWCYPFSCKFQKPPTHLSKHLKQNGTQEKTPFFWQSFPYPFRWRVPFSCDWLSNNLNQSEVGFCS